MLVIVEGLYELSLCKLCGACEIFYNLVTITNIVLQIISLVYCSLLLLNTGTVHLIQALLILTLLIQVGDFGPC